MTGILGRGLISGEMKVKKKSRNDNGKFWRQWEYVEDGTLIMQVSTEHVLHVKNKN